METDKTTLDDLIIFNRDEEFSVFGRINYTVTTAGKEQLKRNLSLPLPTVKAIREVQDTLAVIASRKKHWPVKITNGTVLVIERFYEAGIDLIPAKPGFVSAFTYSILHNHDFTLIKYTVKHFIDFLKGMRDFVDHFQSDSAMPLQKEIGEAAKILSRRELQVIFESKEAASFSKAELLSLAHFLKYKYKLNIISLLSIFYRLDAWYGMAGAMAAHNLTRPEFVASDTPVIQAEGLFHLMLAEPVSYNVSLNERNNFLFLTGANMAGKSTFIKSCGTAVYLAHTGMGVPAKKMSLTFFDGMLSNINVIDNIAKGESYFFNEVQRIKATVQKISDGKKWLILIDELFKGTNVEDAMKCSTAVIEGLLKMKNAAFILSTHLYEIGNDLKKYPNISFNYFETSVKDDQLSFSYQLKEGISNDRLGYLILRKEGVVKMLEDLK